MRRLRLTLLISAISTLVLNIILNVVLKDIPFSIIQFQLNTHLNEFEYVIRNWTETNNQSYINHLFIDYLYMISYTVFFCSILKRARVRLYLLPIVAGITDLGENIVQYILFSNHTLRSEIMVRISGSLSRIKWITIVIVLILFLIGLIRRGLMSRG